MGCFQADSSTFEEAKVYSPEVQSCELAFHPSPCLQDPELHHFMDIATKAAFDLHVRNKPLVAGEYEVVSSFNPLSLGGGIYHQCTLGTSRIAYVLLC